MKLAFRYIRYNDISTIQQVSLFQLCIEDILGVALTIGKSMRGKEMANQYNKYMHYNTQM